MDPKSPRNRVYPGSEGAAQPVPAQGLADTRIKEKSPFGGGKIGAGDKPEDLFLIVPV
jgi:hypothetical protein